MIKFLIKQCHFLQSNQTQLVLTPRRPLFEPQWDLGAIWISSLPFLTKNRQGNSSNQRLFHSELAIQFQIKATKSGYIAFSRPQGKAVAQATGAHGAAEPTRNVGGSAALCPITGEVLLCPITDRRQAVHRTKTYWVIWYFTQGLLFFQKYTGVERTLHLRNKMYGLLSLLCPNQLCVLNKSFLPI